MVVVVVVVEVMKNCCWKVKQNSQNFQDGVCGQVVPVKRKLETEPLVA